MADRPETVALFNPLLGCPALVVEGHDALGRPRQVGDDEADARIKLAWMPLFLSELLTAFDRDLIVLVKLRHYQERQQYEAADYESSDPFTYAYLVLSVDRDLRVTHVVPTEHDFDLVKALGEHAPSEFDKRPRALQAVPAL